MPDVVETPPPPPALPAAPARVNTPRVATISSHFNIFRNVNEAKEGPVTIEEQVKGVERFIRWHERQVAVGKQLLAKILKP